jgi:SagB-type dehydrogenase family enzyme
MSGGQPLYRRSPHVVSYWSEDGLVLHNYATGLRTAGAPLAVELLDFFDRWKPVEQLRARLRRVDARTLQRAVNALERRSLLQRSDSPRPLEAQMEAWSAWNPAAGLLHFSTKDVPYVKDFELGERQLRRQARAKAMPPALKRAPRSRLLRLPPPRADGALAESLLSRRTWRRFSRRPLDLASLGTLLGLTWKVQGWMELQGLGRVPLKTSPSGGARHPIEAYVLAARVRGLRPGLYHYAAGEHGLERIRAGAGARRIAAYLPTQWWYGRAAALVLMTAVFPRVQWRYDHPRAYRVVLAEAGHLCQTFLLVATWLGLAPFCSMALADTRIERDLGLDGVNESVLYAAGVGHRPRGATSGQRPPG